MDESWLDRDWVAANITGVDFQDLGYVPGAGLYYWEEEPFTGISMNRLPDGLLWGIVHFRNGLEHGLSVGWYRDGRVRIYNEMEEGVCHGWHRKWSEDGTLTEEYCCVHGQPQHTNRR